MRLLLLLALLGAPRDPFSPPAGVVLRPLEDDCAGGENMTRPQVVGLSRRGSGWELLLRWEPGTGPAAGLPLAYYEHPTLESDDPEVRRVLGRVEFRPAQELAVSLKGLASYARARRELAFVLAFPDRAAYLPCAHPGGPLRHLLGVTLTLDARGGLVDARVRQWFEAAPG